MPIVDIANELKMICHIKQKPVKNPIWWGTLADLLFAKRSWRDFNLALSRIEDIQFVTGKAEPELQFSVLNWTVFVDFLLGLGGALLVQMKMNKVNEATKICPEWLDL